MSRAIIVAVLLLGGRALAQMPIDAAASSSSLIACSASRPMLRSTMRHTHRPPSQNAATTTSHTSLAANCSAPSATVSPPCSAPFGVAPSEPPVWSRSAMITRRVTSESASVNSASNRRSPGDICRTL